MLLRHTIDERTYLANSSIVERRWINLIESDGLFAFGLLAAGKLLEKDLFSFLLLYYKLPLCILGCGSVWVMLRENLIVAQ